MPVAFDFEEEVASGLLWNSQKHRPSLYEAQRQRSDFARCPCRGHEKSRPISTALAEWVNAPTEMKSTPVSAIARTVARLTPPLASVRARPLTRCTAFRN